MKAIWVVALGVLGLGVLVVGSAPIDGKSKAQAPITVAFDMIIDDDGDTVPDNFCPGLGNAGGTDCTLGPIDDCVAISDGDSIQFDVVMQHLPSGENIAGPDLFVGWPGAPFVFNLIGQTDMTSSVNIVADDPASAVTSHSHGVPDAVSPHYSACTDMNSETAEANLPFTQGVLFRYTATVGPGVPAGTYGLYLTKPNGEILWDPILAGWWPGGTIDLCAYYSCAFLDATASTPHGLIAVDTPCPGPPVGGIAELSDVSGSGGRSYIALAGLAGAALAVLIGGLWYARRRWLG